MTWQVSITKTDHVGPQHPKNLYIDIRTLILNSNGWESKVLWKKWSLFQVAISIWCYIVYHKHVEDEPILTHVFQMGWYLFDLLWKWNMLPIAHQNAPNTRNLHWDHFASFEWTSWLRSCDFMNWYPQNDAKWIQMTWSRFDTWNPKASILGGIYLSDFRRCFTTFTSREPPVMARNPPRSRNEGCLIACLCKGNQWLDKPLIRIIRLAISVG